MANLSNINNKFLFTDGDFLKIGNLAPINNISSNESGISVTNSNVASIALDNTAASGKTFVIYSDDGGKLNFYDVDASSGRLVIDSSGNATFAGNVTVNNSGDGKITVGGTSGLEIIHNNAGNTIAEIKQLYASTSNSAQMKLTSGFTTFHTGTAGTERMRIDSSGDTTFTTGAIYHKIKTFFDGSYTSGFKFSDYNGGIWYDAGADDLILNAGQANSQMLFQVAGSERMRIDSSGTIISSKDGAGLQRNLLLSNLNDTDGDATGIGFSMLNNNTYVKSGIYFKRTTTQGRGSLLFLNNNEFNGNNASLADQKMALTPDGELKIGSTDGAAARLHIETTAKDRKQIIQGNATSQGIAQFITVVNQYPVVSAGTQLIIPFTSQGNLNSNTIIKIMGHSARFNAASPLGFEATIQVGHLNSLSNVSALSSTGNISGVSTSGMNVIISFTTAYTYATSDGIFATIQYMTNNLSYSIQVNNIVMN